MKPISYLLKKATFLIFCPAMMLVVSCQKQDSHVQPEKEQQPVQKCECETEIALRGIAGEVFPIKDEQGQTKLALVKKQDKYIL
jgi:hypothetical protein